VGAGNHYFGLWSGGLPAALLGDLTSGRWQACQRLSAFASLPLLFWTLNIPSCLLPLLPVKPERRDVRDRQHKKGRKMRPDREDSV
ncbi:hypothetical protein, partial [Pantoea agglomerans]|uniref:hypothetical protein n=1 Tax=Enterobacter agglomerans TaxID=549 RepID=UPI00196383C5